MVGDNFQQKKEKIVAWFEKKILGAGDPERLGLIIKKSIMLQFNYVTNSSMNDRPDIQQSLSQESNRFSSKNEELNFQPPESTMKSITLGEKILIKTSSK